jgi:hypothetical protein
MSSGPVIAFGQQPCGFFPRRFLFAKIQTARRLQSEIGGEIIFFYHDSDHDPRETRTILRHRKTNEPATLNFEVENKIQRKFSPLFLKRISPGWQGKTELQLPNYVERHSLDLFKKVSAQTVADFCLSMYQAMGLLDGIRIVKSSDPAVRQAACAVADFFVDVPWQGQIVRARFMRDHFQLHEGGDSFISLPLTDFSRSAVTPSRDTRLRWMQSVLRCTHYVAGAGEQAYLNREETPEITFVSRESIDRSDEAYVEIPH